MNEHYNERKNVYSYSLQSFIFLYWTAAFFGLPTFIAKISSDLFSVTLQSSRYELFQIK